MRGVGVTVPPCAAVLDPPLWAWLLPEGPVVTRTFSKLRPGGLDRWPAANEKRATRVQTAEGLQLGICSCKGKLGRFEVCRLSHILRKGKVGC